MGFIAEIHLAHDELPLAPTIERCGSVTLRYEYETTSDTRRIQFVSAFEDESTALVESMATDPTVSNPECIATFENRSIYRIVVDTDFVIVPDRCAEYGLYVFTITSGDNGWVIRAHLPDRDALTAFRKWCRDREISFHVNQLYDSSVSDDRSYFLTERQHEILTIAYYAGYFEVPRGVTQDALAERLGISDSAVSQRLRRAISELITATLENNCTPADYS
ncbi:helix-turn-helix domain-containing protein [Natrinema halophilum]|uniref:Helix-turn-helix domain-containing protein n=1 Tax=Natrinema halophilum TaxID=1699371 RepID=A0A7D5H4M3_9EURY|nr:helix-turn-helix domain-containing protein [Natrinema halophilum]QLG50751.1 helix-turn-helix domain-containing protein [Natrinema halophilum]